jgi:ATPase family associated with various cellular activities (AAA)
MRWNQSKNSGKRLRLIHEVLQEHFSGLPPDSIVSSARHFPARMRADLQRALEVACLDSATRMVGIHCQHQHEELKFSVLLQQGQSAKSIAPLQYEDIDIGERDPIRCLVNGLALFREGDVPAAVMIAPHVDYIEQARAMTVEIAVPIGADGAMISQALFLRLEQAIRAAQSYRGKILSLERRSRYSGAASGITVHKLRTVTHDQVILPAATLAQIDSNIVQFAGLRERLRSLGMSTKKGLLFYGPPGTGKTHTIHYLAASLPHHTTLLVTAEQVALLPEYFQLARLLQPAILVIEDVDLIARDRTTMESACEEVMLNMLLNEMDGLREDADIFFILTTNRPETIEAALAARPGRIDQAIEFPVPDDDCRRRLVELYRGNLQLPADLGDEIVRRTAGVSASFIKELMRRVAQHHIASDGTIVTPAHVDQALTEMLLSGGTLNLSLLGGGRISTNRQA